LPVHAGNSGGPLINPRGAVVGVVTSKLNVVKMLEYSGDFPENVSFAVKSSYLEALLKSMPNRPSNLKELPIESRPLQEIAKSVQGSILLVVGL
jgi:S1-C subfamily serine protease